MQFLEAVLLSYYTVSSLNVSLFWAFTFLCQFVYYLLVPYADFFMLAQHIVICVEISSEDDSNQVFGS